jgi:hypothetical protein
LRHGFVAPEGRWKMPLTGSLERLPYAFGRCGLAACKMPNKREIPWVLALAAAKPGAHASSGVRGEAFFAMVAHV